MEKATTAVIMAAAATAVIKDVRNSLKIPYITGAVKAAPVFCDHITERMPPSGYTTEKKTKER